MPVAGWLAHLTQMTPEAAVGGAVEPGSFRSAVDWAAYFCEFGRYMLPLPRVAGQLPGADVVYGRACLPDPDRLEQDAFYETFINAGIGGLAGHATDSALVVVHERTWTARAALTARFDHGRGFAALRTHGHSLLKRAPFLVLALALPLVLVLRVVSEPWRRRRLVSRAVLTLPWIIALSASWTAGEFAGYAAVPGSSLDRWR